MIRTILIFSAVLFLLGCQKRSEYCFSTMNGQAEWKQFCYASRTDCDSDQKGASQIAAVGHPTVKTVTGCLMK